LDECSLRFGTQHDWGGLHQLERLHPLLHRRLVFLEMIRSEVRFVGAPVAVDFEDLDVRRIVLVALLQHSLQSTLASREVDLVAAQEPPDILDVNVT
jgi:hypothetical protein